MRYCVYGDDVVGLFTALSIGFYQKKQSAPHPVKLFGGHGQRLQEPNSITLSKKNRRHLQKLIRHYWNAKAEPHIPNTISSSDLETLLRLLWQFNQKSIEPMPTSLPRPEQGVRTILAPASLPTLLQKQTSNDAIHRSTYHVFSYSVPPEHKPQVPYYANMQIDCPLENVTVVRTQTQQEISLHYPSNQLLDNQQKTSLGVVLNQANLEQRRGLIGEALRRAHLAPYVVISGDHALIDPEACRLESYSVARIYNEVSGHYLAGTDILGLTPGLDPNQAFNAARWYFRPSRSNFHLQSPNSLSTLSNLHRFRADDRLAASLAFTIKGIALAGSIGGIITVLAVAQLFHLSFIPVPLTITLVLATLGFTLMCIYLLASGKTEDWEDKLLGRDDHLELIRLHEYPKAKVSAEAILEPTEPPPSQAELAAQIEDIVHKWREMDKPKLNPAGFWQAKTPAAPHTITLLASPF